MPTFHYSVSSCFYLLKPNLKSTKRSKTKVLHIQLRLSPFFGSKKEAMNCSVRRRCRCSCCAAPFAVLLPRYYLVLFSFRLKFCTEERNSRPRKRTWHNSKYHQLCMFMNIRIVQVVECPPQLLLLLPGMLYSSLQEYLEIVSHPNSYVGYIEIAAAQQFIIPGIMFPSTSQCCLTSCHKPSSQQEIPST